jgi:hypothetical protein
MTTLTYPTPADFARMGWFQRLKYEQRLAAEKRDAFSDRLAEIRNLPARINVSDVDGAWLITDGAVSVRISNRNGIWPFIRTLAEIETVERLSA